MFYTEVVLGRKGPLARVWLAAHSEKKLTKAQIVETNIGESIEAILTNKYNLALRTSSHLLVGIVRIYDRKLAYLLVDCREALAKVRRGLRPAAIQKATVNTAKATKAVTLPDAFYDFDDETFDVPILPAEEANGFGDMGLEETDSVAMQDERALNGLEELMQPEFGDPADLNMFLAEDVSNEPEESRKSTMHISDDGNNVGGEFDVDQPGLDDPNLDAIIPEENDVQESEIERLDLDAFKPPPAKKRRVADSAVNQQQTKRATQVDEEVEVERASYRAWLADTSDLIEAVPKPGPRKANPFRRNEWPRNDVLENGLMFLSDSDDDDDDDEEVLQPPLPEGSYDEGVQLDDVGSPLATIHEVTERPSVPGGDGDYDNVNYNEEEEEEDVVEEGEGEIGSEELEERRWSKRTEKIVASLRTEMKSDDEMVSFFGMVRNHSRSQVAAKFYALLVLSRNQVVSLKQEKAYGDIAVGKGEAFDRY